ncbi:hypothetical protein FOL47_006779 [Perkinsus chesapeaki]|uniref:Palmitoyltransferase n=1 Tax=Perkinsus chesapeaki TaxID=330153 RepID=A0A7J6LPK6_PERCH|nr:hypothetical protein FOL47_006779 [Perkinsus chesapeaki]
MSPWAVLIKVGRALVLGLVTVVPTIGVAWLLPNILVARNTGPVWSLLHGIFAVWLCLQLAVNFYHAVRADPGFIKGDRKPDMEATGQYELRVRKSPRSHDTEEANFLYAPRYCEWCKNYKPPRAHHCSKCNRCVDKMDHHCEVTGNCVGARNQGSFLLVFVFGSAACIYAQFMIWSTVLLRENFSQLLFAVRLNTWQYITYGHISIPIGIYVHLRAIMPSCAGAATLMLFATFGSLIGLVFMFWGQLGQMMRNVTYLEKRPYKAEFLEIAPKTWCPIGPRFYDSGSVLTNIEEIFGPNSWLRLVLPLLPSKLDGPDSRTCPYVIAAGDTALDLVKKRKADVEASVITPQPITSLSAVGINTGHSI